jgi:hypothetical protein
MAIFVLALLIRGLSAGEKAFRAQAATAGISYSS